jgi:transcriptional regulator with XRE-family HTH domain
MSGSDRISGSKPMHAGITLAEWRKAEGVSQKETAERLSARLGRKIQAPSICQWENGVMPGADVAEAIWHMTRGRVTGDSFGRRKAETVPATEGDGE